MSTNGEKGASAASTRTSPDAVASAEKSPNVLAHHQIATANPLAAICARTPPPSRIMMSTRSARLCNRYLYFHLTLAPPRAPSNLRLPQGREDFPRRARGGTRHPQRGRHL